MLIEDVVDKSGTIIATSNGEKITMNKKPTTHKPASPTSSTAVAQQAPAPTTSAPAQTQTVYVTKTGKKVGRHLVNILRII